MRMILGGVIWTNMGTNVVIILIHYDLTRTNETRLSCDASKTTSTRQHQLTLIFTAISPNMT